MRIMRSLARSVPVVALLLTTASHTPVHAAGPSIIMIYGAPLERPVFAVIERASDLSRYAFLSCAGGGSRSVRDEGDRPYVGIAMYWMHDVWRAYLDDRSLLPVRVQPNVDHLRP